MWDFQQQLKVGSRGEELFLERYPEKIELADDHYCDFRIKSDGRIIELKTDTYSIEKTDNFFIERWSDVHTRAPGGPWQANKYGASIFCYYFIRNNIWFQFEDIPALLERIEELTASAGLVYIKNRRWVTGGYKIKRADLEDLYDIYEF